MSHAISCPQCKRQIPLDPKAAKVVLGGTQSVQCASCKHTWMPESDEVKSLDAAKSVPEVPRSQAKENPLLAPCPKCQSTNKIFDPATKRHVVAGGAFRCKACNHKWFPCAAPSDTPPESSSLPIATSGLDGFLPWLSKEPAPFTPTLWDRRERGLKFYVAFIRIAAPLALFIGLLGGAVSACYFVHYGNEVAKYQESQDAAIGFADTLRKVNGREADYSTSRAISKIIEVYREGREASLWGIFWNPLLGLSASISLSVVGDLILLALRAVHAIERSTPGSSNATALPPSSDDA